MKIIEYKCHDLGDPGWEFDKVRFDRVNLLVGDSATGKSRFLNTIFNLGRFVVKNERRTGLWEVIFEHNEVVYEWKIEVRSQEDDEENQNRVMKEELYQLNDDARELIVERTRDVFRFDGRDLPKLPSNECSISLLKEEPKIKPIYEAFSTISRRRFSHDALSTATNLEAVNPKLVKALEKHRDIKRLYHSESNLNVNLYILSKLFPNIYDEIIGHFKHVFPFVNNVKIGDISELGPSIGLTGSVPVFMIQEKKVNNWIPIMELSSGMQKVLLIVTDISILPEGGVYFIDEYENSLGINAIDFFPEFILSLEKDAQFFITSHHPYIINEMPPENWYVFHRDGLKVNIKFGKELSERFGKSKQKAFIQLINDPFYTKGVQ